MLRFKSSTYTLTMKNVLRKKMGHNEFQIYKNILILTKTFWSKDTSHTHDLKVCNKTWQVPRTFGSLSVHGTHAHAHSYQMGGTLSQMFSWIQIIWINRQKTCLQFISTTRGSYCSSSSTLHTSIKSTLFKKVSELMIYFFSLFFLNIIRSSSFQN